MRLLQSTVKRSTTGDRRVQVSWAALETPQPAGAASRVVVSWAALEVQGGVLPPPAASGYPSYDTGYAASG